MTQTAMLTKALAWNNQAPHETAKDAWRSNQWSVIPLDSDKRPCTVGGINKDGSPKRLAWKKYQTEQAHEKQIDLWQKQYNPPAWAVVTGNISSIVIFDWDGEQGLKTMELFGIKPHVQTGSNGRHTYFQHPGWPVSTLNSKSKQEMGRRWPGLDIRADGGYAAFCGRNMQGPYRWLRDFQPEPLDILPDDLRIFLGLMDSPEETQVRNTPAPIRTQANSRDFGDILLNWALNRLRFRGRNDGGFDLACQLRDNNFSESEARSIMIEYARHVPALNVKGQYEPYTDEEALTSLASCYTAPARRPWESTLRTHETIHHSVHTSNSSGHNGTQPKEIDLCSFDADDAGNSDAMNALYGQKFLYCPSIGWFYHIGTHWHHDVDGAQVKKLAIETLRQRRHAAVDAEKEPIVKCTKADEKRVNSCVNLFKVHVSISIDVFDRDPNKINCKNGVLDLRTGELEAHSPVQRFTYCLSVDYAPSDYALWVDSLHATVGGGQEVIDYLQMAVGYSLTGHTREEILFYLFGPSRSGKGTFAEALMALLPTPISTMVDFNSFTAKREGDVSNFDLAPLKPSRMIFASESNRSQSLNPAKIKQLTGGDQIRACYKHKDFFAYRPQFKVWMMSNHPVNGDPEDDALWGRVRVIEFPNSFLGMEDKTKKARLKEPDILQSILYWAVQGAIKWYALGAKGLTTPAAIVNVTKAQRDELDYVQEWLDACTEDHDMWVSNEDIIASYMGWCDSNNVQHKKSPVALSQSLKAKGYTTGIQKKVNGKNKKGVEGFYIYPLEKGNGNDGNA